MPLEDIMNLPVHDISMEDSVCFLWGTTPLLPEAFEVLKSWGFKYKTAIYWHKTNSLGLGYWFRGQIEICLLGIKGKIKPFRCQKPNIIQSKSRGHSRKPTEMYEIIESLDISPKIELFAREHRTGWDVWGDQVQNIKVNKSIQIMNIEIL